MASVSELVEDVAEIMQERVETVNAYARALIDAEMLPKSRGRAIAQVGVEDIVTLFLAVALAPKIKDTADEVAKYLMMRRPGVHEGFPESMVKDVAGIQLADWAEIILTPAQDGDEKALEYRRKMVDSRLEITLNWLEIEFHIDGEIMRFKQGEYAQFWDGYFKRQVTISGRAILMLGFGKGRGYGKAAA